MLIALTPQGHALEGKSARRAAIDPGGVGLLGSELVAMKDEIVALRDRLNAVIGE